MEEARRLAERREKEGKERGGSGGDRAGGGRGGGSGLGREEGKRRVVKEFKEAKILSEEGRPKSPKTLLME